MAAVSTFDVTATTIQEAVKFVFSATSDPTTTQVTAIILRAAARANGLLRSLGFDPALILSAAATETSYSIVRSAVIALAAAEVLRALAASDPELARAYERTGEKIMADIRANPEILSDAYSQVAQPGQGLSHFEDATFTDSTGIETGQTDALPIFRVTQKW